ncbi:hypothetical protein KUCAC02_035978 [Chaenocephalus aceratus]|nr:hypothetical protein KUCAC02_035978 [Chaenocephalus aceratus]
MQIPDLNTGKQLLSKREAAVEENTSEILQRYFTVYEGRSYENGRVFLRKKMLGITTFIWSLEQSTVSFREKTADENMRFFKYLVLRPRTPAPPPPAESQLLSSGRSGSRTTPSGSLPSSLTLCLLWGSPGSPPVSCRPVL